MKTILKRPGLKTCAVWIALVFSATAAAPDISRLPPPATGTVDYDRQIKPILEQNCLKCHGEQNPKGQFRITSKNSILKGSASGVVVVPGESAKSPLIHFVARLIEDSEMPPTGKGEPLTPQQVGLLRAWIDQGVPWSASQADQPKVELTLEPEVGGFAVEGNKAKFQEHHGLDPAYQGNGLSLDYAQRLAEDVRLSLTGRYMPLNRDGEFELKIEKTDLGYIRMGLEQYRRYYSDAGGYYTPYSPAVFDLDRKLTLDKGRAYIELALRKPDWPRITLGYEYQYKRGDKTMLVWGPVGTLPPENMATDVKNYYPSFQSIDNYLHVIRLDADYSWRGWQFRDQFRTEVGQDRSSRTDPLYFNTGTRALERQISVNEGYKQFLTANAMQVEKEIMKGWTVAGGWLYTHFSGDASFNSYTFSPIGNYAGDDRYWRGQSLILKQDTWVGNLSTVALPWPKLSLSAGAQVEYQRQTGFGSVDLDEGLLGLFPTLQPASFSTGLNKRSAEENIGLRYTGVPYTVLFAEGSFRQEVYSQDETLDGSYYEYIRDTEAHLDHREARAGFTFSPWQRVSLTSQYRYLVRRNSYDHPLDEALQNTFPMPGSGYSAFITERDEYTHMLDNKISVRLSSKLRLGFGHKLHATDYYTETHEETGGGSAGGRIFGGNSDGHIFSSDVTFTPVARLALSTAFTWRHSRTSSGSADAAPAVATWRGDTYTLLNTLRYVLSSKNDARVSYIFSRADYRQDNEAAGIALGPFYTAHGLQAGLTRRWNPKTSTTLRYIFYTYDEPLMQGYNDYTAHGVFLTLTKKLL